MNLVKIPPTTMPLPAITAEAEDARNEIALLAVAVTTIETAQQNDIARNVAVEIRTYLKSVEETRALLTRPLLEGQRQLKRLSDDHVAPLSVQLARIEALASVFLVRDRDRVAAEEAARWALASQCQSDSDVAILAAEPLPEAIRATGQTLRRSLGYEVTDIKSVYAVRPELCKLEISPAAVRAVCIPEVPVTGLRLWWEDKATFTTRL